jgi:hypothetical protein
VNRAGRRSLQATDWRGPVAIWGFKPQAWFILGTTGSVLGELPQFRFSFLQEPALISAMLAAAGSLVAAIWAALHLRILLLSAVTFLFLADFLKNRRPKNYPPGPMRLPFVGCLFHLDPKQPHLSLQQVGRGNTAWLHPETVYCHQELEDVAEGCC